MVTRRELARIAREGGLGLSMTEKDYVLGWLISGFSSIESICFTGGTALSKVYFPKVWRLSEDLDFILIEGDFGQVMERIKEVFSYVEGSSDIGLRLKSSYQNPSYLQLKIQYSAVLGKNWVKVDVTRDLVGERTRKELPATYLDYPKVLVNVSEGLGKCRDSREHNRR